MASRLVCCAVLFVLGCVPAGPQPALPAPSDIPRLRELLLRDSADLGARVGLAVALRSAGQTGEALAILEAVVAERPDDPGPHLLLGLTCEEAGCWQRAGQAYQRYIVTAASSNLRQAIEQRLRYVEREALEAEVRAALRAESEFGVATPDGRTVAVMPFLFQAADSALRPLSRALADLLVTDLGYTDRLRVLERARVQLLLEEMGLAESGLVDPGTAARSGRLLRAGHVVQGTIGGGEERLLLGAVVVAVGRDSVGSLAPLEEQDAIDRLLDMEKRLALGLYASLGVELAAAERERVMQRPTGNLQALLAFGRGLEAEDRGDWAEAVREYERALALDPGFGIAETRAGEASAISEAEETTVQVLVATGVAEEAVPVAGEPGAATVGPAPVVPGVGTTDPSPNPVMSPDPIGGLIPDPLLRDPGAEVLGQEGIGVRTLLRIIFHRPSGGAP